MKSLERHFKYATINMNINIILVIIIVENGAVFSGYINQYLAQYIFYKISILFNHHKIYLSNLCHYKKQVSMNFMRYGEIDEAKSSWQVLCFY